MTGNTEGLFTPASPQTCK